MSVISFPDDRSRGRLDDDEQRDVVHLPDHVAHSSQSCSRARATGFALPVLVEGLCRTSGKLRRSGSAPALGWLGCACTWNESHPRSRLHPDALSRWRTQPRRAHAPTSSPRRRSSRRSFAGTTVEADQFGTVRVTLTLRTTTITAGTKKRVTRKYTDLGGSPGIRRVEHSMGMPFVVDLHDDDDAGAHALDDVFAFFPTVV